MKERISLPTEEQIHTERLNRELITEDAAVEVTTVSYIVNNSDEFGYPKLGFWKIC